MCTVRIQYVSNAHRSICNRQLILVKSAEVSVGKDLLWDEESDKHTETKRQGKRKPKKTKSADQEEAVSLERHQPHQQCQHLHHCRHQQLQPPGPWQPWGLASSGGCSCAACCLLQGLQHSRSGLCTTVSISLTAVTRPVTFCRACSKAHPDTTPHLTYNLSRNC